MSGPDGTDLDTRLLRAYLRTSGRPAVLVRCADTCRADDVPTDELVDGLELSWTAADPNEGVPLDDGDVPADLEVVLPGCVAAAGVAALLECLPELASMTVAPCERGLSVAREAARIAGATGHDVRIMAARGDLRGVRRVRAEAPPLPRRALWGGAGEDLTPVPRHPRKRLTVAVAALTGHESVTAGAARRAEAAGPADPSAVGGAGLAGLAGLASGALRLRAQGCYGDGVCVRACPQDALELRVDGTAVRRFALLYEPARCDGCGACLSICPQDALTSDGVLSWADVIESGSAASGAAATGAPATGAPGHLVLRSGMRTDCERCAAPAPAGQRLCHVCRARSTDPFGVVPPPGFALDPATGGLVRLAEKAGDWSTPGGG